MSQRFVPAKFQQPLPTEKLIVREAPQGDEVVPFDVTFVGAGPAGLSGAIELARLCKEDPELNQIEIGVLEKAGGLGGHSLSGAVVNPVGFQTLFPEMDIKDFPFRRPVTAESVYYMTETSALKIPTPPTMKNHGNYVASICEMVRWLGEKAEGLGVNILTSFPADSLLVEEDRVVGVRTTPAGLGRDGQPGAQAMPATDISSQVVVLSEGTRGPLAQAFFEWQNISAKYPQIYALGVKELWKVKSAPKDIIHTLGWPLPKDTFGGSWLYPMADDVVSFGLVAGLDYKQANMDVHQRLQAMKAHPLFQKILEGGECLEWGAKTIPEGGFHSIPQRLTGNGALVVGDSAGFVNVPALKGVHYSMLSGIMAARSIFEALKKKDVSQSALSSYDQAIHSSNFMKDLRKVRNMRHAFKSGFYMGGVKSVLMTLTGGAFPGDGSDTHNLDDAAEWKEFGKGDFKVPNGSLSKVDAVYLSGNKTRDDIPQHLIVGEDIPGDVAEFYSHVCPAGVYERQGDKLVVNAPNCVDCKATDVLGPRWTPREGGSGPDYKQM
ncbi:MAG: electron transfer flavoprotein [Bdellovibrionaceae bacterium]|nr:electron transfer flavoprotein [Pseudobdellovibrionaceae bacterium]|tara:strand:- start:18608 stop:20257 length:1650 start_codon:yes stop_codon:yes gene_type:complete